MRAGFSGSKDAEPCVTTFKSQDRNNRETKKRRETHVLISAPDELPATFGKAPKWGARCQLEKSLLIPHRGRVERLKMRNNFWPHTSHSPGSRHYKVAPVCLGGASVWGCQKDQSTLRQSDASDAGCWELRHSLTMLFTTCHWRMRGPYLSGNQATQRVAHKE